jgi:hypothetical protein
LLGIKPGIKECAMSDAVECCRHRKYPPNRLRDL